MNSEPNILELREQFQQLKLLGVLALIDYLASPDAIGLIEIGSSTLDLKRAVKKAKTSKERCLAILFKTQKFHLGSGDGSVTPLQSIAQIAKGFEKYSKTEQELFDNICEGLAAMSTAVPVGMVERYDKYGHISLTAEEAMTERKKKIRNRIN